MQAVMTGHNNLGWVPSSHVHYLYLGREIAAYEKADQKAEKDRRLRHITADYLTPEKKHEKVK